MQYDVFLLPQIQKAVQQVPFSELVAVVEHVTDVLGLQLLLQRTLEHFRVIDKGLLFAFECAENGRRGDAARSARGQLPPEGTAIYGSLRQCGGDPLLG